METQFHAECFVSVNAHPQAAPRVAVIGKAHAAVHASRDLVLHFADPDVLRAWAAELSQAADNLEQFGKR